MINQYRSQIQAKLRRLGGKKPRKVQRPNGNQKGFALKIDGTGNVRNEMPNKRAELTWWSLKAKKALESISRTCIKIANRIE